MSELVVAGDIFIPKSRLFPVIIVLSVHSTYVYVWTPSMFSNARTKVQWLVPEYKELKHWFLNHDRA